jgi:hypothetical protein
LRHLLLFQLKLAADALRDFVLSPLSIAAFVLDVLRKPRIEDSLYLRLMLLGRRSDRMINLFDEYRDAGTSRLIGPSMISRRCCVPNPRVGKRAEIGTDAGPYALQGHVDTDPVAVPTGNYASVAVAAKGRAAGGAPARMAVRAHIGAVTTDHPAVAVPRGGG